jgi:hypothetical protein
MAHRNIDMTMYLCEKSRKSLSMRTMWFLTHSENDTETYK